MKNESVPDHIRIPFYPNIQYDKFIEMKNKRIKKALLKACAKYEILKPSIFEARKYLLEYRSIARVLNFTRKIDNFPQDITREYNRRYSNIMRFRHTEGSHYFQKKWRPWFKELPIPTNIEDLKKKSDLDIDKDKMVIELMDPVKLKEYLKENKDELIEIDLKGDEAYLYDIPMEKVWFHNVNPNNYTDKKDFDNFAFGHMNLNRKSLDFCFVNLDQKEDIRKKKNQKIRQVFKEMTRKYNTQKRYVKQNQHLQELVPQKEGKGFWQRLKRFLALRKKGDFSFRESRMRKLEKNPEFIERFPILDPEFHKMRVKEIKEEDLKEDSSTTQKNKISYSNFLSKMKNQNLAKIKHYIYLSNPKNKKKNVNKEKKEDEIDKEFTFSYVLGMTPEKKEIIESQEKDTKFNKEEDTEEEIEVGVEVEEEVEDIENQSQSEKLDPKPIYQTTNDKILENKEPKTKRFIKKLKKFIMKRKKKNLQEMEWPYPPIEETETDPEVKKLMKSLGIKSSAELEHYMRFEDNPCKLEFLRNWYMTRKLITTRQKKQVRGYKRLIKTLKKAMVPMTNDYTKAIEHRSGAMKYSIRFKRELLYHPDKSELFNKAVLKKHYLTGMPWDKYQRVFLSKFFLYIVAYKIISWAVKLTWASIMVLKNYAQELAEDVEEQMDYLIYGDGPEDEEWEKIMMEDRW